MPYKELLKTKMSEKNYSIADLVREAKKLGFIIDRTYISKILSGKMGAPSEEISRKLAEALGVDERIFVTEGYIDKAPKEIMNLLYAIREIAIIQAINIFRNKLENEKIEAIRSYLKALSLTELFIELMDNNQYKISMENKNVTYENTEEGVFVNVMQPKEIPVKDNAMAPLITTENMISLEMKKTYKSGDILVVKLKTQKEYIIRNAILLDDKIVLTALDKKVEDIKCKYEDVKIIGRVCKIITAI